MRQPNDNYPTPGWCVDRLLEAIPSVVEEVREGLPVLEPCAVTVIDLSQPRASVVLDEGPVEAPSEPAHRDLADGESVDQIPEGVQA